MGLHGEQAPLGPAPRAAPRPEDAPRAADAANTPFLPLFDGIAGDPDRDSSAALYRRYADRPALARYRLLAKLGARMLDWFPPSASAPPRPGDELAPPAGYTYLGQFLAHDLSFAAERIPIAAAHEADADAWNNLRETQLKLDTIYGGGPRLFPLGFVCPVASPQRDRAPADRTHFRLGRMLPRRPGEAVSAVADDLPRLACPAFDPAAKGVAPGKGATDVLVADPRNDDHPIIAQLCVLFLRLHNHVADRLLAASQAGPPGSRPDYASLFERSRAVTQHVYRTIVWNDYLRRLLDPDVYRRYAPDPAAPEAMTAFLTERRPGLVPIEFSHAAFRFGHAMIRSRYTLPALFSIEELLDQSSAVHPERMPFDTSWRVDWRLFFDDPAGVEAPRPDLVRARQLGPTITKMGPPLVFLDDVPDASGRPQPLAVEVAKMDRTIPAQGMATQDLVRGASVPMIAVDALVERMACDPALAALVARQPLLADPQVRAARIAAWLDAPAPVGTVKDVAFDADEREFLSRQPPLYFFVLFEAEAIGAGRRLGPVGSFVLAETLFAKLGTPVAGAVPGEPAHRVSYRRLVAPPPALAADLALAFAGAPPRTMWDLVGLLPPALAA